MNILTFSSLFPNSIQPQQGLFVEKRLQELLASKPISGTVVAPVPWFPLSSPRFGRYGQLSRVPREEQWHELRVHHPRYTVVPGLSWRMSPPLMKLGALATIKRLHEITPFDLIDAHFFYPDGVAAVQIGQTLGIPVAITARGSDLNLMRHYRWPRRYIVWAANHADVLITVSAALKRVLIELGIADEKITVLRNGVDLDAFKPVDAASARRQLNMPAQCLLSVGNLVELKGHDLIIKSLQNLPETHLWIIGQGPEKDNLQQLAVGCGVRERVNFVGTVEQSELPNYYSAALALVLASSREGWANVLLESMACGTPTIGSPVGGTPEIIRDAAAGVLMRARDVDSIVCAFNSLMHDYPNPEATRRYAENFSWDATSDGQYDLFRRATGRD